jgi:hypothetical protein
MGEGLRDAAAEPVTGTGDGNGLSVEADVHVASWLSRSGSITAPAAAR